MMPAYTEETYPKELVKIKVDGVEVEVLCELGDTEGSLRQKARLKLLEARVLALEKMIEAMK